VVQTEMRLVSEDEGPAARLAQSRAVTPRGGPRHPARAAGRGKTASIPLAPPGAGGPRRKRRRLDPPPPILPRRTRRKPADRDERASTFASISVFHNQTGADIKDKDFAGSAIICGDANCNRAGEN